MFIRRSFDEFPALHTEGSHEAKPDAVIDWRCLYPEDNGPSFPSERSLIGCGAWAKPKRPKPA
jgi:hypothetical protein